MKTQIENDGRFLTTQVRNQLVSMIDTCLQSIRTVDNQFIINDTQCFRQQRTKKITPCVTNSATFISSRFQARLNELDNARGETKIKGQAIDGFIQINLSGKGYQIKDKNRLLEVLHGYIEEAELPKTSIHTLFPMFYGMYVERSMYGIDEIPETYHSLFEEVPIDSVFRVGVEFETGNVASSFRAINKLFILFQQGEIDAGVFVTCIDKANAATRIWPVSNRNGSFQELRQRNYQEQISLPLICIGFAPDSFSNDAPMLGKYGTTYTLRDTGRVHESEAYAVFTGEDGEEILVPN